MGLTYSRANRFGAGGPDEILTRPHYSRNVVGDGNCLFRAFAKIITGSEQDHYAVRFSILSYMITIGHLLLGHHLARDMLVSMNTLRELAWTGMAPGVRRWRSTHWHTCCTSTFTRIKSAVPIGLSMAPTYLTVVCRLTSETCPCTLTLSREKAVLVNFQWLAHLHGHKYFLLALSSIWRHGSASILGTTRTVTRAPMLMYWAGLSRIASTRERRSK